MRIGAIEKCISNPHHLKNSDPERTFHVANTSNNTHVGDPHRRFFMKNIQENLFIFKMITNFAAQFVNAWTSNTHK